jgi:DNA-binding CsgD family transcriptional regulator
MAIVDAGSRRFVAASPAFSALFAREDEALVGQTFEHLLPPDTRESVLHDYEAVTSGRLDGYQAHRKLIDGSGRERRGHLWVRRIDVETFPNLVTAVFLPAEEIKTLSLHHTVFSNAGSDVVLLVTDHDWTIQYASKDIESADGREHYSLVEQPILAAVHPAVAADFLLAVTTALSTRRGVVAHAQLRAGSGWRRFSALIAPLCSHTPARLGVVLTPPVGRGDEGVADVSRERRLEEHIWRIAAEVLSADLLPKGDGVVVPERARDIAQLTAHQWQITRRLLNGDRVPEIAKAMHLSQSTVRNNLTAVFRRFGVHSQVELIAALKSSSPPK